jgi:hypothetical protein
MSPGIIHHVALPLSASRDQLQIQTPSNYLSMMDCSYVLNVKFLHYVT